MPSARLRQRSFPIVRYVPARALLLALIAMVLTPSIPVASAQPGSVLDAFGGGGAQPEPEVTLSIAADRDAVEPGGIVVLAVTLNHLDGWHSWPAENQVDLGEDFDFAIRTTITSADENANFTMGRVQWPEPHPAKVPSLTGSGTVELPVYQGRAIAYVPVRIADSAEVGTTTNISIIVGYQSCNETMCLPPEDVELSVPVRIVASAPAPKRDGDFANFDSANLNADSFTSETVPTAPHTTTDEDPTLLERVTRALVALERAEARTTPGVITSTWIEYTPEALANARAAGKAVFVDFTAEWCINCKVFEAQILDREPTRARLRSDDVVMMKVDLTGANPDGEALLSSLGRVGIPTWAVFGPTEEDTNTDTANTNEGADALPTGGEVIETYSAGNVLAAIDRALGHHDATAEDTAAAGNKWFGIIPIPSGGAAGLIVTAVLAAVGGFILNLTPCVLPVIPIKVLTISQHAGEHKGRTLFLGLMMALGVVAFWFGIGLPVALVTGWADPSRIFGLWYVTIPLGVLIVLMSLGLMGMFTLNLPQKAYMINPKADNASGSFLFGVMTGVLGLPCFGLVAGALIPAAAALGSVATLVIFTALGIGMAAPYLVLSAYPKLLSFVPRTGPASELVKEFLGLLMIAAGVYFFGTGLIGLIDTYPWLGRDVHLFFVSLALLAAAVWLIYRTVRITPSMPRRAIFGGLGLLLAVVAVWLSFGEARAKYEDTQTLAVDTARIEADEAQRIETLEASLAEARAQLEALAQSPALAARESDTTRLAAE